VQCPSGERDAAGKQIKGGKKIVNAVRGVSGKSFKKEVRVCTGNAKQVSPPRRGRFGRSWKANRETSIEFCQNYRRVEKEILALGGG